MNALRTAFFAAAVMLGAQAFAEDYPIKLHRPVKVGDKFQVEGTGTGKQTMSMSADGKVMKNEDVNFTAVYEAEETVLEVGEKGKPMKVSIKISKLTRTEGGRTEEVAAKGAVIVASKPEKKKIYEIDGQPADAKIAKVLDLFISAGGRGPTDDDILGTKERKKVGDTWAIDGKQAAEDLQAETGGKVEDLAGTVKLDGVDKDAAGDVEKISARLTGKFTPPLPPNVVVDGTALEIDYALESPVNADAPRRAEALKMKMDFSAHADGPAGQKMVLKGNVEQAAQRKMTPAK